MSLKGIQNGTEKRKGIKWSWFYWLENVKTNEIFMKTPFISGKVFEYPVTKKKSGLLKVLEPKHITMLSSEQNARSYVIWKISCGTIFDLLYFQSWTMALLWYGLVL